MANDKRTWNTDRPLTIEEAYALRPRLWWLYTLIVLIIALAVIALLLVYWIVIARVPA
jgi:hypothetical protein